MKLKSPSVNIEGVHWTMFKAALVAEQVYKGFGEEVVITSAKDGKHSDKSLHYQGKAIDIRTWSLYGREQRAHELIKKTLGPDYDVVLEDTHMHIEFDPK